MKQSEHTVNEITKCDGIKKAVSLAYPEQKAYPT